MNRHALAVLEFDEALSRVAARAGSELGQAAVRALRPTTDLEAARAELARVGELLAYLEEVPDQDPPRVPDARRPLKVLSVEGGVLQPVDVRVLAQLLAASDLLRGSMVKAGSTAASSGQEGAEGEPYSRAYPRLARVVGRLAHEPELRDRLEAVVDEEGEVRDDASPRLRSLRGSLRGARTRLVRALERFLGSLPDRIRVPDASVSIRDGRYVIPIRREGKSEVGGIIHGESSTGATLFVEPPVAIRLMNELQELEREEAREVERILRELTGRARRSRKELEATLEALVALDALWARALAARRWEGTVPELAGPDEGELRIVAGRHPLLIEAGIDPVVPFHLELHPDERAVVVSGPNTGGKTVLLKAIGVVHLLAQSGVVPPVGPGTRLPLLRNVFADIGDEQSIAESLSTFSAHLANAIEILEEAGPGTLVLMDEMGTGTDPSEGAALARAILEALVERGARALVTSHLGALKRLDREGSGIVNASLLFDSDRIAPTYELQKGRPGRSFGLAIARRLGVPGDVLDRAERYVDSGELEVESLLGTLEAKERELAEALAEAEAARERARELETDAESRARRLTERERTAESRAREEARQLLLDARHEVEEAIRELRQASEEDLEDAEHRARQRVEEAARRQKDRAPSPGRSPVTSPPADLAPGMRVRVMGSGAKGQVRELRQDRVVVEVGGLRLEVPAGEVEPLAETRTAGRRTREEARESVGAGRRGGWSGPELEANHEADLRGLRVDEVELELGRALDGAILAGLHELRVIHGKGTGAVKARVQELLERDGRVKAFRGGRPGEGGSGVTVVSLE
jgi:DNA mismatch repair protein MutS2